MTTAMLQAVKAACTGKNAARIVVLPLDITADYAELVKAASSAAQAFTSGEQALGIQYLIHNAGTYFTPRQIHRCSCTLA